MNYYLLVHRDSMKGPRRHPTFLSWLWYCLTGRKPVPRYSRWKAWDVWWFYSEEEARELKEPDEYIVHAQWIEENTDVRSCDGGSVDHSND